MRKVRNLIRAFTVLELLAAVTIFSVVLMVVVSVIGQASELWRRSADRVEAFQGARAAFEMLTRTLSQATLNTYLDYDRPDAPSQYLRKSDLKFLITPAKDVIPGAGDVGQAVFFQAPANVVENQQELGGLENLLNGCGYFVAFNDDGKTKPAFIHSEPQYRYRLMQLVVPAEKNGVYSPNGDTWFSSELDEALPVADNIIALILRPQDPGAIPEDLTTDYVYDSAASFSGDQPDTSHQLPPVIQVTMVAIEESAAKRLAKGSGRPEVIDGALRDKFSRTDQYEKDLKDLEDALNAANPPIAYRIFSSAVPLRESKWSKK